MFQGTKNIDLIKSGSCILNGNMLWKVSEKLKKKLCTFLLDYVLHMFLHSLILRNQILKSSEKKNSTNHEENTISGQTTGPYKYKQGLHCHRVLWQYYRFFLY